MYSEWSSKQRIKFQSLSAVTQFILLRSNCYAGVFYENLKISLYDILHSYKLYNKYIAKCEYYDENWNVIYKESATGTENSNIANTEQEYTPVTKDNTPESKIGNATESPVENTTSLSNYTTSEIFKEILTRMINNIGE